RPTIRYSLGADEGPRPAAVATASRSHRDALHGRILDAWGNPVPHASVHVVGAPSRDVAASAETDADGTFEVLHPGARNVRIVAESDAGGYVESAVLEAAAAPNVVLVLEQARTISGVVVDERGVPLPRATVKSWGETTALDKIVVTDDEGRYEIRRVPESAD